MTAAVISAGEKSPSGPTSQSAERGGWPCLCEKPARVFFSVVVPGHGRLCDSADVAYYRDMVTIIRDRVQDLVKKGNTLEQVKVAKLTRDYDPRYGSGDAFVEAAFKSLSKGKR